MPECGELGPMREIRLVVGPPVIMLGHEAVFGPNDLALEVRCQRGVVISQPWRVEGNC